MNAVRIGIASGLCIFILFVMAGDSFQNGIDWFSNAAPISCQEDMACWDCETMGNKRCGIKR